MAKQIVVITGASGFLGSAVCLDLIKDFTVLAIDRREPSEKLRMLSPKVIWHILDIADARKTSDLFVKIKSEFGGIDFLIHFAAYYDFDDEWVGEYQRTNVTGTANLIKASIYSGIKRFIFASSVAAMEPPAIGASLNEDSPTSETTPYMRSKSLGEELLVDASPRLKTSIMRIAGVFSDWCELPPLYSLIKLWTAPYPYGCLIPGRGETGIPYIHMNDFVPLIRKIIHKHHALSPLDIFLASPHGAVLHRDLFPAIRSAAGYSGTHKPIHIPRKIAKFGLHFQRAMGKFSGNMPFERPWMLEYVDRPWITNTEKTRQILDWDCTPELGILEKIHVIMKRRKDDLNWWEERNISRISSLSQMD